jgi:hypothetical protein
MQVKMMMMMLMMLNCWFVDVSMCRCRGGATIMNV